MRPVCLLFAAALAAAAQPTLDPGGWTAAKWGMTDEQILAAIPTAARMEKPDTISHARVFCAVNLSGVDFLVHFAPGDDGHLSRVILTPSARTHNDDATFQRLELLLVAKYGHPWKSEHGQSTTLQWCLPTTTITLVFDEISQTRAHILHVEYSQPDPDRAKV